MRHGRADRPRVLCLPGFKNAAGPLGLANDGRRPSKSCADCSSRSQRSSSIVSRMSSDSHCSLQEIYLTRNGVYETYGRTLPRGAATKGDSQSPSRGEATQNEAFVTDAQVVVTERGSLNEEERAIMQSNPTPLRLVRRQHRHTRTWKRASCEELPGTQAAL